MAHINREAETKVFGNRTYNILASAIGLIPKTFQAAQSDTDVTAEWETVDGGYFLRQGTLYTDGVTGTQGVVQHNQWFSGANDVRPIDVIVAGSVLRSRVSDAVITAETALRNQGLYIRNVGEFDNDAYTRGA